MRHVHVSSRLSQKDSRQSWSKMLHQLTPTGAWFSLPPSVFYDRMLPGCISSLSLATARRRRCVAAPASNEDYAKQASACSA